MLGAYASPEIPEPNPGVNPGSVRVPPDVIVERPENCCGNRTIGSNARLTPFRPP